MLNAAKNKFDTVICWQMGKIPQGDFKVTTLKNPLINNHAVTSKRNLTTTLVYPEIPTYSWPLLQYPIGLDVVVAFFPLLHKSLICD